MSNHGNQQKVINDFFEIHHTHKCSRCGKKTLLAECISCLKGDIQAKEQKSKSNNIKSIMNIHKLKSY